MGGSAGPRSLPGIRQRVPLAQREPLDIPIDLGLHVAVHVAEHISEHLRVALPQYVREHKPKCQSEPQPFDQRIPIVLPFPK